MQSERGAGYRRDPTRPDFVVSQLGRSAKKHQDSSESCHLREADLLLQFPYAWTTQGTQHL